MFFYLTTINSNNLVSDCSAFLVILYYGFFVFAFVFVFVCLLVVVFLFISAPGRQSALYEIEVKLCRW